jgi:regulator of protease activity HflC (stomatin/prohibitin superfamily)
MFVTVYEWEHALLYINGRFSRLLLPGRHRNLSFGVRRDIYILPKHVQALVILPLDVTSADKLLFRLSATITYEIVNPQEAFEGDVRELNLRLATTAALTKLAAEQTVEAFLADRSALNDRLLQMLSLPISGCAVKSVAITSITLPPEVRRMFTEIERAKLDGLAALERARGEHAALRSLANAARMLKGNPELMNLRVLQALSSSSGKRQSTVVLGQGALLPIGREANDTED